MTTVLNLPLPLLLLIHLHILEYPYANNPEYDENVFNSRVRGLRDRSKSMEDMAYFLVSRLEGSKEHAKLILSTYPCLQPSDTLAFRTSLAKYLESLRHSALYSTSDGSGRSIEDGNSKGKNHQEGSHSTAWWWKDVVVRKSLLEECSGERFERILIAFTTHTLLKDASSSSTDLTLLTIGELLLSKPSIYTNNLASSYLARNTWARAATLLLQRQDDLRLLRQRVTLRDGGPASKFNTLSTERLVFLANSRRHDILHNYWVELEGVQALNFLMELTGLRKPAFNLSPFNAGSLASDAETSAQGCFSASPAPPLPIAAAHHPSNLRKLQKGIFPASKPKTLPAAADVIDVVVATPPHAKIVLSDQLDTESRIKHTLLDALAKARKVEENLSEKLKLLKTTNDSRPAKALDLWENELQGNGKGRVDFKTPLTPALLNILSLPSLPPKGAVETRIDNIRQSLLVVSFPSQLSIPVSDSHEGCKPNILSTSWLPQPPTRILVPLQGTATQPPQTAEGARSLRTSTPPDTVKPRSAYVHKFMIGQFQGRNGRRSLRGPRKSIRFSIAAARQQSLFAAESSDEEGGVNNEVDSIVEGMQEQSSSPASAGPPGVFTPKPRSSYSVPQGSRIDGRYSTIKKPKESFQMPKMEPIALPLLKSSTSSSVLDAYSDGEWTDDEMPHTRILLENLPNESGRNGFGDADEYYQDAPSMTLRDILLRADMTQFDLMDDEAAPIDDESFVWE